MKINPSNTQGVLADEPFAIQLFKTIFAYKRGISLKIALLLVGVSIPVFAEIARLTYLAADGTNIFGRPYRIHAADKAGVAATALLAVMVLTFLIPGIISYCTAVRTERSTKKSLVFAFLSGLVASIAFIGIALVLRDLFQ
jgi:uncharacterized membrane protein